MITENQTPSFFQRLLKRCPVTRTKTRCYLTGILILLILLAIGTVYYHFYYSPILLHTPENLEQPVQQHSFSPPVIPPVQPPSGQELLAQQLQKITVSNIPVAEANSMLPSLNNQIAIIQLLLANQQFPAALNLLGALESDAALLPTAVQTTLQTAVEMDRENIQKTQQVVGQLDGQLQQLELYLNQQLLARLAQQNNIPIAQANVASTATTETSLWSEIWGAIKHQLSKGIQVQHKASATTMNEPNFYTAIMLQMALQRAQFALEQGNWAEYQLTLTSLQTWVTTDLLTWLPDAPGMIKTITELAEQPSPFAYANVNNTQRALNMLMQEPL